MKKLVELNSKAHGNLKIMKGAALEAAKDQHVININANEAPISCTAFPIFFMPIPDSKRWALSVITSLEAGQNLYIQDGEWQGTYQPTTLLTYPMQVMAIEDENQERRYTIGIDEKSPAFSETEGEPLFDADEKATVYLARVTKIIEASIQHEINTIKFCNKLVELSLITPASIKVAYAKGAVNTLNGLHTIDEKALQALDIKQLGELRDQGYLAAIYAALMSSFQLNLLLKKHNSVKGNEIITAINMERGNDETDSTAQPETEDTAKVEEKAATEPKQKVKKKSMDSAKN